MTATLVKNIGYVLALLGLAVASAAIVFVVNAPKWLTATSRPAVTAQP